MPARRSLLMLAMSRASALTLFQFVVHEKYSSSACSEENRTGAWYSGLANTLDLGLGCALDIRLAPPGQIMGSIAYEVQGTDLVEYVYPPLSMCNGTPSTNTTTKLNECSVSAHYPDAWEVVRVETAPATKVMNYDNIDDCSGTSSWDLLSPLGICMAPLDVQVANHSSEQGFCQGHKLKHCRYRSTDCSGPPVECIATDLKSCLATSRGSQMLTILGSDTDVASICSISLISTTTTTTLTPILGNVTIYNGGTCNTFTLQGVYPVTLEACKLASATTSQKFICSSGSILYRTYNTPDCAGEGIMSGPYEQGQCAPQGDGTSSWVFSFSDCVGTANAVATAGAEGSRCNSFMIFGLLALSSSWSRAK